MNNSYIPLQGMLGISPSLFKILKPLIITAQFSFSLAY